MAFGNYNAEWFFHWPLLPIWPYQRVREIRDPDLEYKVLTLFTTKNSEVRWSRPRRFRNWWRGFAQNGHSQTCNLHSMERRTEMRLNHPETRMTEYFFHTLKDRGSRSLNPHNDNPLLYLKCWGSDYPYLRGVEQQKRWLPLVVNSAASKTLP